MYSELTEQLLERVEKDMERDRYMAAEEAKEYGLIDAVMARKQKVPLPSEGVNLYTA